MIKLDWKFRNTPADGERRGGDLAAMSFERDLETFVREVLQNSHDAARDRDEPVSVVFRFEELEGDDKSAFLEAANWTELSHHLRASAEKMPVLRESIRRTESASTSLRVLGVHDGAALGLSGPEKGSKGRFAMFARNKLLSEKQGTDAGGSFGLGKSVLWTFSGWHTIFAHSLPLDDSGRQGKSRFIGVAQLPFHEIGREEFDGPGWYGRVKKESILGERYARSVFAPAAGLTDALRLSRDSSWSTGTSVLIPDFLPPEGGDARALGRMIADAAARWFWPLLSSERLRVAIEINGDREEVQPSTLPQLAPWLHLAGVEPKPGWRGTTFRKSLPLKVPNVHDAQKGHADVLHHKKQDVAKALEVAVIQSDDLPKESVGQIALMRGSGMIIKIMNVRADRPFVGLVRAGLALGADEDRRIVEQFLRAAEPPSHNDWVKTAPKLADLYGPGYKRTLDALPRLIREESSLLVRSRDVAKAPDVLPNVLKKSLRLASGKAPGSHSKKGRFEYGLDSCSLVRLPGRSGWNLEGWVSSSYEGAWAFAVECALRGDSESVKLTLSGLEVDEPGLVRGNSEARVPEPGRIGFRGFVPIEEFGRLGQDAIFEVQLRRKRIRKEAAR